MYAHISGKEMAFYVIMQTYMDIDRKDSTKRNE